MSSLIKLQQRLAHLANDLTNPDLTEEERDRIEDEIEDIEDEMEEELNHHDEEDDF